MDQHSDTCPCTWLSPDEPFASCLLTKFTGTVGEMAAWAPAGRCVTLRMCHARKKSLP